MNRSIIIVFLFYPLLIFSQKDKDYINWEKSRRLTWDDFKATPVKMGNTAALTTTHLGFAYNVVNGSVTYIIDCRFQKSRSWGLVKNDWILSHEQGHFDIAEIFARKLKKALDGYEFNKSTFKKDLDEIYNRVVKEKENFQQQYDDETNYSREKTKQEEWLKKIDSELNQLSDWSSYHLVKR